MPEKSATREERLKGLEAQMAQVLEIIKTLAPSLETQKVDQRRTRLLAQTEDAEHGRDYWLNRAASRPSEFSASFAKAEQFERRRRQILAKIDGPPLLGEEPKGGEAGIRKESMSPSSRKASPMGIEAERPGLGVA